MTRFAVVWVRDAIDQLAEIWLEAADRDSVTNAANRIDRELAENPFAKGEQLAEGMRALVVPPVRVLFSIRDADRVVEVARVKSTEDTPFGSSLASE